MKLAHIGERGSERPVVLGHVGTPAGVALGRSGGGYLHAATECALQIDRLGVQQHLGAT
jgi:hypothetical protein